MTDQIKKIITASIEVKQKLLLDESMLKTVQEVVRIIVKSFQSGNRIYFAGNGGSAADAQHLAAEFSGRFYVDRKSLPAEALHCNTSYVTAVGNDYSYDVIYSRIIDGVGMPGDVLIGLSTSGNSKNIVKAFESAREKKIVTVGLTGASGGEMKLLSDFLINIPSTDTPRIQEGHLLLGHLLCGIVEQAIFGSGK